MDDMTLLVKPSLLGNNVVIDTDALMWFRCPATGECKIRAQIGHIYNATWNFANAISTYYVEKIMYHILDTMEMGRRHLTDGWDMSMIGLNDLFCVICHCQNPSFALGSFVHKAPFCGKYTIFSLYRNGKGDPEKQKETFHDYMRLLYKAVTEIVDPKYVHIYE